MAEKRSKIRAVSLSALMLISSAQTMWCPAESKGKAEPLRSARVIIGSESCNTCHIIEGEGGLIGPPLDGIGKFRTKKELEEILTRHKNQRPSHPFLMPSELMSHVRLNREVASSIAAYLYHLPGPHGGFRATHGDDVADRVPPGSQFVANKPGQKSEAGGRLFARMGCAACHSINGIGGRIGPALDGVGARRSTNFIRNRIANGATLMATADSKRKAINKNMPASNLSEAEIDSLVAFLLTIPKRQKTGAAKVISSM